MVRGRDRLAKFLFDLLYHVSETKTGAGEKNPIHLVAPPDFKNRLSDTGRVDAGGTVVVFLVE